MVVIGTYLVVVVANVYFHGIIVSFVVAGIGFYLVSFLIEETIVVGRNNVLYFALAMGNFQVYNLHADDLRNYGKD